MPQILEGSKAGEIIKDLARDAATIVEIGTFDGLGSTMCILNAIETKLIAANASFVSLEIDPTMFEIASKNLLKYRAYRGFQLLLGAITKQHIPIDHENMALIQSLTDSRLHYELYHAKEMSLLNDAEDVSHLVPDHIDLLVLDGSEYTTYYEWLKLKDRCQVFILDDTKTLKCLRVRQEMMSSDTYEVVYDLPDCRNGFSVFRRKI